MHVRYIKWKKLKGGGKDDLKNSGIKKKREKKDKYTNSNHK